MQVETGAVSAGLGVTFQDLQCLPSVATACVGLWTFEGVCVASRGRLTLVRDLQIFEKVCSVNLGQSPLV